MFPEGLEDTPLSKLQANRPCVALPNSVYIIKLAYIVSIENYKPFDWHCPLTHWQSPLHQLAPFPCGQSAHEVALWFPQFTCKKTTFISFRSSFNDIL